MNSGIGEGKTRSDHRELANQLYAAYANGRDLRKLVAIIGEEALSDMDKRYLKFADDFEKQFIHQGMSNRTIQETMAIGWNLLSTHLPTTELRRIEKKYIDKYYGKLMEDMLRP